jgi:hypothetical protein
MTLDQNVIIVAAIAAIPGTAAAVFGYLAHNNSVSNKVLLVEVKKQTDGITEKLVASTERAALSEGHAAGVADEQAKAP